MHPIINKTESQVHIDFTSDNVANAYDGIDLILDIDPKDENLSGIEIIDLAEQMKGHRFLLPELKKETDTLVWSISYDTDYDVAYIGFAKKNHGSPFKTKRGKGRLLLNQDDSVVGIDVALEP